MTFGNLQMDRTVSFGEQWLKISETLKRPCTQHHRLVDSFIKQCLSYVPFTEASGLKIRNKLLGKCLQVQDGTTGGRVSLGECSPHSPLQEWLWLPAGHALSSHHTGECLTAPRGEYEGVRLQSCVFKAGVAAVGMGREASSQTWACSKRGHLTLIGTGLHLSATQESTLVFLSREHKQVPVCHWKTKQAFSLLFNIQWCLQMILNTSSNQGVNVHCRIFFYLLKVSLRCLDLSELCYCASSLQAGQ